MMLDRRSFLASLVAAGLAAPLRAAAPRSLALGDFRPLLTGLQHPEGIAALRDGRLFFSSALGAISVREADGRVRHVGVPLAPNGVAVDLAGRAIVANMGLLNKGPGPLQRIAPATGAVETLVAEIEHRPLVASNGPAVASDGSVYCTHTGWGDIARIGTTEPAGFIYRVAPDGSAAIVACDLRGANGLCLDRGERHLYASLTAEGRVRRWRRLPDGSLADPEDFGPVLGDVVPDQTIQEIRALPAERRATLGYCDGIAFDAAGNLWITLPFANRLVALTPEARLVDIVHDPEGRLLSSPTNLCWGGRDLRDLYVVSRAGGTIVAARTAIAGLPLAHWGRT